MIASAAETVAGLTGALRMARFDASGMGFFDASPEATRRSFFAAVLIAPLYALLLLIRFPMLQPAANALEFAAAEAVGYVLSWVAFPVLMWHVSHLLDRRERFFVYITAYNWSLVWQSLVFLGLAFFVLGGVLPNGVANLLWLIALIGILAYTWFIARTALDIPGFAAAGVVGLDFMLTIIINETTESLY